MSAPAVIVVGAGCVGASVAYRLARDGARVTVLDAGAPGAGTSSVSFAWTNSFGKTPRAYHDLNVAGMAEHERLAEELSGTWLHRSGNLEWEETPEAQAELRRTVERLRAWDYAVEMVRPGEALRLEPELRIGAGVEDVAYSPREGYVDVVPLVAALLAAAARLGARVLAGRRVTALLREGDRIRGVVTADGARLEADQVVDCAGPAAGEVARLADVSLPIDGEAGRLIYTAPVATMLSRPVHAPGVQFRPDGGGRVVLSDARHDLLVDQAPDDGWTPQHSLEAAARYLPCLAGARVEATRTGVRPMPRDRHPVVGPVSGLEGFYVVVSHSGITLGPLWGRVAAAELLDGKRDARLEPFRPDRFLGSSPSPSP